LAILMED
jgi:hypothetical protein